MSTRKKLPIAPLALLALSASFAACHCAARAPASAEASGSARAPDSLQLIAEARQRGEIDDDQATLYRVYAVVDGAKLPARFRSEAPQKGGTTVLREAKARFPSLRPDTREALRPYLFPKGEQ